MSEKDWKLLFWGWLLGWLVFMLSQPLMPVNWSCFMAVRNQVVREVEEDKSTHFIDKLVDSVAESYVKRNYEEKGN